MHTVLASLLLLLDQHVQAHTAQQRVLELREVVLRVSSYREKDRTEAHHGDGHIADIRQEADYQLRIQTGGAAACSPPDFANDVFPFYPFAPLV